MPSNQISQTSMSELLMGVVRTWIRRMWAFNWFVTAVLLLHVVALPVYTIAAIADPRLITNAPAFVKPLKFVISISIYLGTFLWLMTLAQSKRWWVHLLGSVTAFGLLVEIVLITIQAIRGVPSHFNQTTPFDAIVFNVMGMAVVIISVMNLFMAIWLLFQHLPDPSITWGLRLGIFVSLVGMLLAFNMTSTPSPGQRVMLEANQRPDAFGAHSVGIEDGGPGLPFVGWSTVGGDLRAPHFIGLHGMQILPLLGLALSRRRSLNQRQQLALTITGGAGYLGWVVLLTWQALRGQSVIAPDAMTLTAYAALIGFVLVSTLFTLMGLRQPAPSPVRAQ